MFERAQSETVGVILLTAVITLTVTGAGAVVFSEWQADIEQGPVADIDSAATPINATLEHRGGETLYPNTTTIRLVGVDEAVTLSDRFAPGTSLTEEFELLDGRFELLVIHEPTGAVVHSESYDIDPSLEEVAFEIANRSDPAYVLKDKPANYTVDEVFEVGVTRSATETANLTVEESSKLGVNEGASTVTGLDANSSVNVTATVDNETTETEVRILESEPALNVETLDANATSLTSANVSGNLTDLGGLPEVDLGVAYWPVVDREFNGEATDNGDKLIADGRFYDDTTPVGYTHNDDFVHDNKPFEPGENRTYAYRGTSSDPDIYGSLRTSEQTSADGSVDGIDEVGGSNPYEEIYPNVGEDETVELTVRYTADGSAVEFSVDGTRVETFDGLDGYDELYMSSYGGFDRGSDTSLRIVDITERGEVTHETAAEGVGSPTEYNTRLTGLDPGKQYGINANAEIELGGQTVADAGRTRSFTMSLPTASLIDVEPSTLVAITATGELTDLGAATEADLGFTYWPVVDREFNADADDNGDLLIAAGEFYADATPYGYTHEDLYIHDNKPFDPGENRTYTYRGRNDDHELWGSLRTTEQTDGDAIDAIDEMDGDDGSNENLPHEQLYPEISDGDTVDMKVVYTNTGSAVRFYVDGSLEHVIDGLDAYDELYVSSYGGYDDSRAFNSLRLINVAERGEITRESVETGIESAPIEKSSELTGLAADETYGVAAYAERTIRGQTIRNTTRATTVSTARPTVELANATGATPVSITATGELTDLGTAQRTDLGFIYWPVVDREFNGNADDTGDGLVSDGSFYTAADSEDGYTHEGDFVHDNEPFEPGENRTYTYRGRNDNHEIWGSLRTAEQTTADGGINAINEISGDDGTSDDLPYERIYPDIESGDTVDMEVTYAIDGSAFRFYVDGTLQHTIDGLEPYDELYVSSYGGYDDNRAADSLRLIDVAERGPVEDKLVDSEDSGPTEYDTELTGLDPDRPYDVAAYTERRVGDRIITNTSATATVSPTSQTVETTAVTANGSTAIDATGELVDFGDAERAKATELSFAYTPFRKLTENASDNSDGLVSAGSYDETFDAYTLDDGWLHDNAPLENGSTRRYLLDNTDADADLFWALRYRDRPVRDEGVDDIRYDLDIDDTGGGEESETPLPDGTYRIEVSRSTDGRTVDVHVYDEPTGGTLAYAYTDVDVSSHSELYFSTYQYYGDSDDGGLRLTGVFNESDTDRLVVESGVTTTGEYSTAITGLESGREYAVAAVANRTVDGRTVTDTGEFLLGETGS